MDRINLHKLILCSEIWSLLRREWSFSWTNWSIDFLLSLVSLADCEVDGWKWNCTSIDRKTKSWELWDTQLLIRYVSLFCLPACGKFRFFYWHFLQRNFPLCDRFVLVSSQNQIIGLQSITNYKFGGAYTFDCRTHPLTFIEELKSTLNVIIVLVLASGWSTNVPSVILTYIVDVYKKDKSGFSFYYIFFFWVEP